MTTDSCAAIGLKLLKDLVEHFIAICFGQKIRKRHKLRILMIPATHVLCDMYVQCHVLQYMYCSNTSGHSLSSRSILITKLLDVSTRTRDHDQACLTTGARRPRRGTAGLICEDRRSAGGYYRSPPLGPGSPASQGALLAPLDSEVGVPMDSWSSRRGGAARPAGGRLAYPKQTFDCILVDVAHVEG